MDFNYTPDGAALVQFMNDPAFVRGLQGPVGSGKSVCCVAELFRLALNQERSIDPKTGLRTGPRKVRTGVIRNTTPQLETTTMKTWLEWLPEEDFGRVRWRAPFRQDIRIPELGLEWEIWFLALDRDDDVRKLLSFEFTNIWCNEARELSRGVITAAVSRLDRYPRVIEGGATRACMIMDTNAPDEEHWWAIMSGQVEPPDWMTEDDRLTLIKPHNWSFHMQPPAMLDVFQNEVLTGYELNPERNNAQFTTKQYYLNLIEGQTREWIKNMVQNKIGRLFAGRPVYRDFSEKTHIATEPLEPVEGEPLYMGVDFGRTPAVAIGQVIFGQWRTIDEIVSRDMGAVQFAPIVARHLREKYQGFPVVGYGDPAGDNDSEVGDTTPLAVFKKAGVQLKPCWTNDPEVRIGAVQKQLVTMVEGRPAYVASPSCTYLNNGKKGGYAYKKDREEIDKKSIYSHVSDAEQYAMLAAGFGKELIGRGTAERVARQASRKQSLFDRGGGLTARQQNRERILSRRR